VIGLYHRPRECGKRDLGNREVTFKEKGDCGEAKQRELRSPKFGPGGMSETFFVAARKIE
jgi:hypothetical protein